MCALYLYVFGAEVLAFMLMLAVTLPETNSSPMKIPTFPCKYHQNGGFSMAMLVYRRVAFLFQTPMLLKWR